MQELTTCIRILDDWAVDVEKLREAGSRLGEHEDHLRNLEAEQSDLRDRIEVRSADVFGLEELARLLVWRADGVCVCVCAARDSSSSEGSTTGAKS